MFAKFSAQQRTKPDRTGGGGYSLSRNGACTEVRAPLLLGENMARTTTLMAFALGAICLACGDDKAEDDHSHEGDSLTATLAPKSGNTTLAGKATFSGDEGKVEVKVELTGAPEGEHGVHIHETGDCSAADAMSAGGHWNPTGKDHGKLGANAHLGDIGNITVKADGTGSVTATNPAWELSGTGANSLKGKALIIHAMPDDLMSQPVGNAGGRIGCGEIE